LKPPTGAKAQTFSTGSCQEPVLKVLLLGTAPPPPFSIGLSHEPVLKGHLKCFLNFLVVPALFHIEAMINIP
jgi:hypothetical protein